jgi:GT2 family glycosyltransferase
MAIFILTLTLNAKDNLEKLYPTLQNASSFGVKTYWFIKDNSSIDGTKELVESWKNDNFVKYFHYHNNLQNFSEGNNWLVEQTKQIKTDGDDYYLLCNNDITIQDMTSIRNMYEIMKKDKNVGIVGARLFYPGGNMIQHAGVVMSPKHGNNPHHIFTGDRDSAFTNQNREFQAVTGAFLLIRKSCFENQYLKKMDERYNWCFEDVSMCLDVKYNQNKKVVYCGKTDIWHYESMTLSKSKINIMYMRQNVDLFKKMWGKTIVQDYYDYNQNSKHKLYA